MLLSCVPGLVHSLGTFARTLDQFFILVLDIRQKAAKGRQHGALYRLRGFIVRIRNALGVRPNAIKQASYAS